MHIFKNNHHQTNTHVPITWLRNIINPKCLFPTYLWS